MSNDECPRRCARWGFTWIEWLVIIAIIAILASMVFPAIVQAKRKTLRIACGSNLQPIALASCVGPDKT